METLREGSRFHVLGRKHCANSEEKHKIGLFINFIQKNETIGTWSPMFPGPSLTVLPLWIHHRMVQEHPKVSLLVVASRSSRDHGIMDGITAVPVLWWYNAIHIPMILIGVVTFPWYLWWEQACDFFGGFTNQPWSQLPGGQGTRCLIEQVHWEEDKCVELVSNRKKGCQVHANMFDSVWSNWV